MNSDSRGKPRCVFRRAGFPSVTLRGLPGSKEFMAAYQQALGGGRIEIGASRTLPGTLNAALAGYYTSLSFRELALGTQKLRRRILERLRVANGDRPMGGLRKETVIDWMNKRTPSSARQLANALRGLFKFAMNTDPPFCRDDPTRGVPMPKVRTTERHTWTEEEIARYEARQRSECCSIRNLRALMLNQKMFARRLALADLGSSSLLLPLQTKSMKHSRHLNRRTPLRC
jgi:integrase